MKGEAGLKPQDSLVRPLLCRIEKKENSVQQDEMTVVWLNIF